MESLETKEQALARAQACNAAIRALLAEHRCVLQAQRVSWVERDENGATFEAVKYPVEVLPLKLAAPAPAPAVVEDALPVEAPAAVEV